MPGAGLAQLAQVQKQGQSGLGLEGQKKTVQDFTKHGIIVDEFTEIESGKKNNRKELEKAMACAKLNNAILVIAKLDRLSRNAFFVMKLQSEKVPFVCCDNPHANELTIGIMAVIAQDEAKRTSERTKDALEAKRARLEAAGLSTNWRTNPKQTWSNEARQKSQAVIKENAATNEHTHRARDYAKMLRTTQYMTLLEIANHLNERKFVTPRGKAFQKTSVWRLLE